MNKFCILMLLLLIAPSEAKRLVLLWSSFDCVINPNIVTIHRCFILEHSNTLITAEVEYNREFEQYNANFALHLPRPPFKEFYKAFELSLDVCQFFKGSYKNKFVNTAYKSMLKYSNMPKKCPQPKGFYYYRNMSVGDNLPSFLPKYDFKITIDFFLPNIPIINVTLIGRLLEPTKHKG